MLATRLLAAAALVLASACSALGACESRYASSPERKPDGCGFRNPVNPEARPTANTWKIWARFFFETKVGTEPVDAIPVRPLSITQLDALDPQGVHIVRFGHASTLLKLRGKYWLVDPMFSERASPFSFMGPKRFHKPPMTLEQLPPIEGVVISHDHYDHLDAGTIEYLAPRAQRFFVALGVGERLKAMGVPAGRITEFDWTQTVTHDGVHVTSTRAQHFSGRTLSDRDDTLWTGWVLQSGAQRIFYSGDSGYSEGFRQIGERFGGFDVAMIENGQYDANWPSVHMTPEESVLAAQDVRARVLFPVHNSTFDLAFHTWHEPLDRIADLAAARQIEIATPEIGEVFSVGQPRTNMRWWTGLK